jgi:hypothetical protein
MTSLDRVAKALTLSGLIVAINIVAQLFSVPILMAHWGVRTYGAWVALTNLGASVTLMNLGVQSYVTNQLSSRNGIGAPPSATSTQDGQGPLRQSAALMTLRKCPVMSFCGPVRTAASNSGPASGSQSFSPASTATGMRSSPVMTQTKPQRGLNEPSPLNSSSPQKNQPDFQPSPR